MTEDLDRWKISLERKLSQQVKKQLRDKVSLTALITALTARVVDLEAEHE